MSQTNKPFDESDFIWVFMFILVALWIGGYLLYKFHWPIIHGIMHTIAKIELIPFVLWDAKAQKLWSILDQRSPYSMTWTQEVKALTIAGQYARWWLVPWIFTMGWLVSRELGKMDRFTRRFTMKTLLKHNAALFPVLRPVGFRKHLITEEPTATGPWRVMESPMLFALRHKIIKDKQGNVVLEQVCFTDNGLPRKTIVTPEGGFIFDDAQATKVYVSRMGPHFPGYDKLKEQPDYIRGLIGAFAAVGIGYKEKGGVIFDTMADSFNEEAAIKTQDKQGIPQGDIGINIADADAWIERAFKERPITQADVESDLARSLRHRLSKHEAWLWVWLGELLQTARMQGGAIPPNEFIWLRPTNRPLWYFLHAIGGNTVSAEGAGPWCHWQAEQVLGRPIDEPYVKQAVDALKRAIDHDWDGIK